MTQTGERKSKLFCFTVYFRPIRRGKEYYFPKPVVIENVVKHGIVGRSSFYGFTRKDETEIFFRTEYVERMESERM